MEQLVELLKQIQELAGVGIDALQEAAGEQGADIAVYGHTHVAEISLGDIFVLNPGSVARPRDESQGSFLLLDLVEGHSPKVKLVRLKI